MNADKNIRKKIADILDNGKWHDVFGEPISMGRVTAYAITDELIKAGMRILPCKVGDVVYAVSFGFADGYDKNGKWYNSSSIGMCEIKIDEKNIYRICDSISLGWTFLTREEAEAKLEEVRGLYEGYGELE